MPTTRPCAPTSRPSTRLAFGLVRFVDGRRRVLPDRACSSAPDSMDIISIWSQWHSLTPRADGRQGVRAEDHGHEGDLSRFLLRDEVPEPFLAEIGGGRLHRRGHRAAYAKAYCQGLDGQVSATTASTSTTSLNGAADGPLVGGRFGGTISPIPSCVHTATA